MMTVTKITWTQDPPGSASHRSWDRAAALRLPIRASRDAQRSPTVATV